MPRFSAASRTPARFTGILYLCLPFTFSRDFFPPPTPLLPFYKQIIFFVIKTRKRGVWSACPDSAEQARAGALY